MDNTVPIYLSAPLLTTLLIEAIKFALRKWVLKDPNFDFAPIFYQLTIPFFNLLFGFLLGLAGFSEPVQIEWMSVLNWALAIVVTLVLYNAGIKPLKEYKDEYTFKNQ